MRTEQELNKELKIINMLSWAIILPVFLKQFLDSQIWIHHNPNLYQFNIYIACWAV